MKKVKKSFYCFNLFSCLKKFGKSRFISPQSIFCEMQNLFKLNLIQNKLLNYFLVVIRSNWAYLFHGHVLAFLVAHLWGYERPQNVKSELNSSTTKGVLDTEPESK